MTQFHSDPDLLEFMADRQHDINEAMREASEIEQLTVANRLQLPQQDLKQFQQLQENFHDQTTMDTSRT